MGAALSLCRSTNPFSRWSLCRHHSVHRLEDTRLSPRKVCREATMQRTYSGMTGGLWTTIRWIKGHLTHSTTTPMTNCKRYSTRCLNRARNKVIHRQVVYSSRNAFVSQFTRQLTHRNLSTDIAVFIFTVPEVNAPPSRPTPFRGIPTLYHARS